MSVDNVTDWSPDPTAGSADLTKESLEEIGNRIEPGHILAPDKNGKYRLVPGPALVARNRKFLARSVRQTLADLYLGDAHAQP